MLKQEIIKACQEKQSNCRENEDLDWVVKGGGGGDIGEHEQKNTVDMEVIQ